MIFTPSNYRLAVCRGPTRIKGPVDTGLIRDGRSWDSTKQQLEAKFVAERGLAVDRVAGRIVRGIKRGAARVLIGRETYLIDTMARCCPVWTNSLIARFRRRIRFL